MSNQPPVPRTRVRSSTFRSDAAVNQEAAPIATLAKHETAPKSAPTAPPHDHALTPSPQSTPIRKVGKNSPPIHGQIKKGEVRNPRGRPTGSKNTKTLITEAFNQKVSVKGMRGKISLRNLAIIKQVRKAAEGDTKAFQTMLLLEGYSPGGEASEAAMGAGEVPLDEKDKAILDFLNQKVRQDLMRELQKPEQGAKKEQGK